MPLVAKATMINYGMIRRRLWSLFKKILSIAGSSNQAVADVLPATNIEKNADSIILSKYFFE